MGAGDGGVGVSQMHRGVVKNGFESVVTYLTDGE